MNRFSQEVPPKTAWTVVAGLVLVFIMVFSLASNSDGNSDSMLGQVISATKATLSTLASPFTSGFGLFSSDNRIKSVSPKDITSDLKFEACVTREVASLRGMGVVAINLSPSDFPRGAHVTGGDLPTAIATQNDTLRSIAGSLKNIGIPVVGGPIECIFSGVIVNPLTLSQIRQVESLGYIYHNFGSNPKVPKVPKVPTGSTESTGSTVPVPTVPVPTVPTESTGSTGTKNDPVPVFGQ